ncbi:TonB-dependent receptor [bacterium]|nr:TonB-dependent receptor [bacterium]
MKARYAVIGLLFYATAASAGITGKIRGTVKDARSGEQLPGVNVVITHIWQEDRASTVRSEFGAATSISGEYIILNVPPGVYSLTASMIGYTPSTQQRVKVNVDRTTTVNFDLTQTVLEGGEVVVIATKDLLQLDVAATENYVSAEQYQNTPFANRVEDILSLQSGVSGNIIEGEIQIRAGETREVGFLLDGMSMTDRKFNRPVIAVQPGTVQEIKIMRNGFNAEYGQSRSGMINVVSKNPSDQTHFSVDYQFDPANRPHSGRSVYDTNYRWEWRLLAGPMAYEGGEITLAEGREGIKKTWIGWNKFSENLLKDKDPNNDLTADEAFELWKWLHRPIEYGNRNGHNVDATLSSRVPVLPWRANFMLGGKYEYHPFSYPQSRTHYDERLGSLKIVNELGSNMKLTLNSIYSEVRSVTQGNSTSSWSEEDRLSYSGGGYETYYPFYKPTIDRYTTLAGAKLTHALSSKMYYEVNLSHFYVKWHMGRGDSAKASDGRIFHGRLYYDPQSGWIPKDKGVVDIASGYRLYGGGYTWDDSYNRRTSLNGAMTYQFHPAHELKTGFEFNYDILRENRVHWHNEDATQEFLRRFKAKPYEMGLYAQDKIEFQGMVANIGLRFDYFNTNTDVADIHQALTYKTNRDIWEAFTNGVYPTTRAKPKYYFSPRIGISHPLSVRSKIYFNFGHFVQTPPTMGLFRTEVDGAMPRMQWISDSNLPLEKTIAYELGYDMGISDFFQLHVGAFYKDYFDVASGMVYAHSDQSLVIEWPAHNNYAEIRGVEIELRKTAGRFITGWLNYNYIKKSEANLEIPNLSQIPIVTDDPMIGRNGVLWGVPRSNIINIQPNARGVITLSTPRDWGPRLGGYPVLQNINLSFQVYYQSGARLQHPRSSFRDLHPDLYFHELDRYWANLRLSRMFTPGRMSLETYMDISNILHTKFRNPPGGTAGEDYYDDLFASNRINEVGTDKVSDPMILRTESDNVYWATLKEVVFGIRIHL